MNISGVLVRARPEDADAVRSDLLNLPGVEVHALGEDGRLVITIERDSDGETTEVFQQLSHVDGVLSASLVYHQFEPHPEEEV